MREALRARTRYLEVYTIEIFLPHETSERKPVTHLSIEKIAAVLAGKFGGSSCLTIGRPTKDWKDGHAVWADQVATIKVMAAKLDVDWWCEYRGQLAAEFDDEEIAIRISCCQRRKRN